MCEDAPSRFISKLRKSLRNGKVFKRMLEREKALQEYFFEKCIFY